MLRRAENVNVTHQPNFLTGKGPVHLRVGNRSYLMNKMHKDEFQYWKNRATQYPVCFGRIAERRYWLFQGKWHWDNDGLTPAQVHALLVTKEQRTQQRINRAQGMVAMQHTPAPTTRGANPDDLKQYVWQRDRGLWWRRIRPTDEETRIRSPLAHGIAVSDRGRLRPERLAHRAPLPRAGSRKGSDAVEQSDPPPRRALDPQHCLVASVINTVSSFLL